MPYGKKKVYRRKRFVKRYRKKIKGPKRLLPKMQRAPELKSSSVSYDSLNIDNTGSFYLLNGIDQGTSATTRIGNKIKMATIELIMEIQASAVCNLKIALIYDKQANGTTLISSDYLTAISGLFPPWCLRNLANKTRFVTLLNSSLTLMPQISGSVAEKSFTKYIKIPRGVACLYSGSGSTISSITSGALYLYVSSNLSASVPKFWGSTRVKFSDE